MTALLILYPRFPVARLVGPTRGAADPDRRIDHDEAWVGSISPPSLPDLAGPGDHPTRIASRVSERVLIPLLAATLTVVGANCFSDNRRKAISVDDEGLSAHANRRMKRSLTNDGDPDHAQPHSPPFLARPVCHRGDRQAGDWRPPRSAC